MSARGKKVDGRSSNMKRRTNTRIRWDKTTVVLAFALTGMLAGAFFFVMLPIRAASTSVNAVMSEALVNQPGDAGDGICDSTCTLRDAVEWVTLSGGGMITFAPIFTTNQPIILTNILSIGGGVNIE